MTLYSLATFIPLSVNKMPPAAKCREISQNHVPHCSLYFLYFFFNHCWSTNCKHVICSHADNMGPINSDPVQSPNRELKELFVHVVSVLGTKSRNSSVTIEISSIHRMNMARCAIFKMSVLLSIATENAINDDGFRSCPNL